MYTGNGRSFPWFKIQLSVQRLETCIIGRDGDLKPVPIAEKTAKNPKGAEFSAPLAFYGGTQDDERTDKL